MGVAVPSVPVRYTLWQIPEYVENFEVFFHILHDQMSVHDDCEVVYTYPRTKFRGFEGMNREESTYTAALGVPKDTFLDRLEFPVSEYLIVGHFGLASRP